MGKPDSGWHGRSPQIKASQLGSEFADWIEQGSRGVLPAGILNEFVAAGDRDGCCTMVKRSLEAGADRVVLVPNPAGFRSTSSMVDQRRASAALLEPTEA